MCIGSQGCSENILWDNNTLHSHFVGVLPLKQPG